METLPLGGAERRTGQGLGWERTVPRPGRGPGPPHRAPAVAGGKHPRVPTRQDCQVSRKHTSPGRRPRLSPTSGTPRPAMHPGQRPSSQRDKQNTPATPSGQPSGRTLGHRPLPPVPLLPAPPWVASHPRRSDTSSPTAPRPGHTRDISRPGMQCGLSPEPQSIFTLSVPGTGCWPASPFKDQLPRPDTWHRGRRALCDPEREA